MKAIRLNKGYVALVDDEDYDSLSAHDWIAVEDRRNHRMYAVRVTPKHETYQMHREILGVADPKIRVIHRDRDGLNNRRSNILAGTWSQSVGNKRKTNKPKTSVYKGVSWARRSNRWCAYIKFRGTGVNLGLFPSETEAAEAYDAAARLYFGEFARMNFT